MKQMYKVAVIGDRESIYGFASLGLSVFPIDDKTLAPALVEKLVADKYGVIYITENMADAVSEQIEKYREKNLPAIILIPGISGNTGDGIRDVHKSVEKAVGSDILSN